MNEPKIVIGGFNRLIIILGRVNLTSGNAGMIC